MSMVSRTGRLRTKRTTQLIFDRFEPGHQRLLRFRSANQSRGVDIVGAVAAHSGRFPGGGDGFDRDRPAGAFGSRAWRFDTRLTLEPSPRQARCSLMAARSTGPATRCSSGQVAREKRAFAPVFRSGRVGSMPAGFRSSRFFGPSLNRLGPLDLDTDRAAGAGPHRFLNSTTRSTPGSPSPISSAMSAASAWTVNRLGTFSVFGGSSRPPIDSLCSRQCRPMRQPGGGR